MRVITQLIKFLCYCVIVIAEFTLKMLLDVVLQAKKPFQ